MEVVTIYGFLMTYWLDEYRVWQDIFPYNCSKKAVIPSNQLWIPDMVISNSEQLRLPRETDGIDIMIDSDGTSARSVSGTITFYCPLNMAMFPFDVQTCSLIFDSWALDTTEQTFNIYGSGTRLVPGYESEEWDVTDFIIEIHQSTFGSSDYAKVSLFIQIFKIFFLYFINFNQG